MTGHRTAVQDRSCPQPNACHTGGPALTVRRLTAFACAAMLVLGACSRTDRTDDSSASLPNGTAPGRVVAGTGPKPTIDDDGVIANPMIIEATGGTRRGQGGGRHDVAQFGYQEHEYLFDGTAKTYPPATLPPAPYRSRMIVWTPTDPARFNGTTVIEWAEVSDFGQFELTVELNYQAPLLEQEGYAF